MMLNKDAVNEADRLPRAPRKLSWFVAQEMLYDYTQGRLDVDRKAAVESCLQSSPELRQELKIIREAEKYAGHLALTRISPTHLEELSHIRSLRSVALQKLKWPNWPDLMKWASEALVISIVVAMAAMLIPWEKLNFNFSRPEPLVTLAEIKDLPVPVTKKVLEATEIQGAGDKSAAIAAPNEENKSAVSATDDDVVVAEASSSQKVIPLKGMLYRILMNLEYTEGLAEEVKEKILAVGGVKAGQVELGWRKKNPNGSYFHFTMPEANYQHFISLLGAYGSVRIYKNPHERVMPEGQMRVILWIEDKVSSQVSTPTTEEISEPAPSSKLEPNQTETQQPETQSQ